MPATPSSNTLSSTHPAPTAISTLSLHDALPISYGRRTRPSLSWRRPLHRTTPMRRGPSASPTSAHRRRSEEHTSELQSHHDLVCRLLLEKKKLDQDIACQAS